MVEWESDIVNSPHALFPSALDAAAAMGRTKALRCMFEGIASGEPNDLDHLVNTFARALWTAITTRQTGAADLIIDFMF